VGSVDAFAVDEVIRGAEAQSSSFSIVAWLRGRGALFRQRIESTPAAFKNVLQDHSQKISRASDRGLLASMDE
jgi:hypothetical protein